MKKLLFVGLCCLCLCGCGRSEWRVENMSIENSYPPRLRGILRNTSTNNCTNVKVNIMGVYNDVKVEGWVKIKNPNPGTISYINHTIYGDAGNIKNLEEYEISIGNIDCWTEEDTIE